MSGTGRWWPGTGSVRFRITLVATLVVALVLAAASVGLVAVHRRSLTRSLEETLTGQVDALLDGARRGRWSAPLDPAGDDDTVAQVVLASTGQVEASTSNLTGAPRRFASSPAGSTSSRVDSVLEPGDHFLVVTRSVTGPTDAPVIVSVGAPLDDVVDSTRSLARSLLGGLPVVVVLLAGLMWWLVGRTLRPVEAIRADVSDIGGGELGRRVPVPSGDDEVSRLARTMNAMLDRVEAASIQQHRFVADASHELRSPLTRIRSELEVDLAHPDGADPTATHRSVLEEVDSLQRLVDDLLLLARSDGAPAAAPATLVDLDDLVLDEAHRAADGAVTVDSSGVASARVRGDAPELGRAVRNVMENAVRHASDRVTVALAVTDARDAVLSVEDDGPGIPADRVDDVFERFMRLDAVRGSAGGTGLGLAIAREVIERHSGTIRVDPASGSGARFLITLPLAEPGS